MTSQQTKSIYAVVITLCCIYFIHASLVLLFVLLPVWYLIFRPLNRHEIIMFLIGALFIIGQNYSVLRAGGFAFAQKDFLGMPFWFATMWISVGILGRRVLRPLASGIDAEVPRVRT